MLPVHCSHVKGPTNQIKENFLKASDLNHSTNVYPPAANAHSTFLLLNNCKQVVVRASKKGQDSCDSAAIRS